MLIFYNTLYDTSPGKKHCIIRMHLTSAQNVKHDNKPHIGTLTDAMINTSLTCLNVPSS